MASWLWFIVSLALFGLEIALAGGFFLLFFAIGAAVVGLAAATGVLSEAWQQWLSFSIFSIVSVVLFRKNIVARLQVSRSVVDRADIIGAEAITKGEIQSFGTGTIELRGTSWRARSNCSETLREGQHVRVVSREGLTLIIEPMIG